MYLKHVSWENLTEKSAMAKAQGQMYMRCMSWKNSTYVIKNLLRWRYKANMSKVYELGNLNSHKEKSVMIEV